MFTEGGRGRQENVKDLDMGGYVCVKRGRGRSFIRSRRDQTEDVKRRKRTKFYRQEGQNVDVMRMASYKSVCRD